MLYLQLSKFRDKGFLPLLLQIYRLFLKKTDTIETCHTY